MRKRGFPSQTRTFRTKRDAESWAKVTESEMLRGVWRNQNEAEKTTLTEALNRYAREVSALKKGAVQEISIVGKIKESPLSRMYLASIQGKDIAKYRDAMLSDEYSPITIKRRLSLLSHMFTVATKEWGISGLVNPIPDSKSGDTGRQYHTSLRPRPETRRHRGLALSRSPPRSHQPPV